MELTFRGSSDDNFVFGPRGDEDEIGCYASGAAVTLTAPNGDTMVVIGAYAQEPASGWLIGVARVDQDDDKHMPDWPIRFEPGPAPYSPMMVVDAPDGTTCAAETTEWRL